MLSLLSLLAGFSASWCAPGAIFECYGHSEDGFGRPMALVFEVFTCTGACTARHARCAPNTYKTDAKRISAIQRATQKTTKVRLGTLSNRALCKDRAKSSSLGSLGLVLERSGALLGWLLAVLGRLLGLLGRFLGGMWPRLGHSWVSLGWSGSLPVCILAPLDAPGRDFFGFGALLGWVLEGFGGMFWHALCCPSRFIT